MSKSIWKFLTSLWLTVVLLTIAIVLVFLNTLAQVHEGIWDAQERWFYSAFVWWGPEGASWKLPVLPGGYIVGTLLLINLIAAHIKRFQWSVKKIGIHLTHIGIVLFLLGILFTRLTSRESLMSLREGQTKVYSESHRENELVFASDFDNAREEVVSIPGEMLETKKDITHAKLPFTVLVKEYQPNGELTSRSTLARTGGQLTGALATVEAEYASAEGLPKQADRAMEASGREAVWRAALKALGQPAKGDLIVIAEKISKEPELAARLNAELKTRFREQMLNRFEKASPAMMRIPSTEAAAMHLAAAQIKKGAPASPESFPKIASNDAGKEAIVTPLPATADMNSRNMPYAVLEIVEGGASRGTWLVSPWLGDQEVKAGGRTYRMAFRFERYYQPFSVKLIKATHEVYPGTATAANPEGIPKNFQSRVLITNPDKGEKREADIYMNNPLRYGGLTYYQYQMGQDETATGTPVGNSTFQIVKNPSWGTPYLACFLVFFGMLYQFMYHLIGFLGMRPTPRPPKLPDPVKKPRETRAPQTVP